MNRRTICIMLSGLVVVLGCKSDHSNDSTSSGLNEKKTEQIGGSKTDDPEERSALRPVSKLQEEEQPRLDTPFYVYGLGQPTSTDFWQGSQSFGTMDKVGVLKSVLDQVPDRQADLIFIRDRKAEREAYLEQNGISLDSQCSWNIGIKVTALVNGKRRLGVTASYGKDLEYNGGIGPTVLKNLNEIWELQGVGANPILLERHSHPILATVNTQAEVPSYTPLPPSPPGTIGY